MRKREWWETEWFIGRGFYLHTFLLPPLSARRRRLTLIVGKLHLLATWGKDA